MDVSTTSLANAIRALSMDAVQAANSGHPGMPMGMADAATLLWTEYLKHNPADPHWPTATASSFSAGTLDAALQLLHLTGYERQRSTISRLSQLGSPCAGLPRISCSKEVEATTGPLGRGGDGVWHGDRRADLNAEYATTGDHAFWVIAARLPDGGRPSRGGGLAGHLGLGRLNMIGRQPITIDGAPAFDLGGYRGALCGLWLARHALRRP